MIQLKTKEYTALVNPKKGARCESLRNIKYDAVILREKADEPYLCGMPVLFPANRISDGRFEFEGRMYKFPINEKETNCSLHGSLCDTEFEVADCGESFVRCVFEKAYSGFPQAFRMEIAYTLAEDGLGHSVKLTNLSEENMPVLLGFHTTFNVPFLKSSTPGDVRLFAEIGDEVERNEKYLPTGKILPPDESVIKMNNGNFAPSEKSISKNCRAIKTGRTEMLDVRAGIRLVYETDKKYAWRLFYNGDATEYICLEPMTCAADSPNNGFDPEYSGFSYIKPGETTEYNSKIYITEGLK